MAKGLFRHPTGYVPLCFYLVDFVFGGGISEVPPNSDVPQRQFPRVLANSGLSTVPCQFGIIDSP